MRRRISILRRRVVVASIGLFAAVWVALVVQMATGHDPALGNGKSSDPAPPGPSGGREVIQTQQGPVVVRREAPAPDTAPAPVMTSQS